MAGHGRVDVQIETSLGRLDLWADDLDPLIHRLFGERVEGNVLIAPQDPHLSDNQTRGLRCGDNGIFKGCPPTEEQRVLTAIAATIYGSIPYDGKYIIEQTRRAVGLDRLPEPSEPAGTRRLRQMLEGALYKAYTCPRSTPLGPWTGGINVDCGCTNRKLGSDMGDGVTGGGLMGKDLSKADVSVNIAAFLKAVASGQVVTAICSIGDENVTFTYADGTQGDGTTADIVERARSLYILSRLRRAFV